MEAETEKKHITSSPDTCGGKPRIAGTRIRVQDVYIWHELLGQSPEEIVISFPQLTLANVHAALAYFFDHRDEIALDIRNDAEYVEAVKSQLGRAAIQLVRGKDVRDNPVSS